MAESRSCGKYEFCAKGCRARGQKRRPGIKTWAPKEPLGTCDVTNGTGNTRLRGGDSVSFSTFAASLRPEHQIIADSQSLSIPREKMRGAGMSDGKSKRARPVPSPRHTLSRFGGS